MGFAVMEKVLSLQEEELKFLDSIRNCINMRIRCDREYAQSLLVVSVCAQKCHLSDDIGKTNIGSVWITIANEMEALSKLMTASAEELTHEVLEQMDEMVAEKKALRKSLIEEHNRYSNKLDTLLKSSQKIQTDYQKCLSTYKSVKNKYEDLWLRLPKKSDNSNSENKIEKKFMETKKKYNKLCQKLHILHNDYCLITNEAKHYENDFRILLIPNLISYHEIILMDSGEKWNNVLMKYVEKTDLTQEKYRRLQNKLKNKVQSMIQTNIYGDLRGKLTKSLLPALSINFNEKLLEDYIGALKPNQLIIDTFTIDSLKQRESDLQSKLSRSQKDIREKRLLQKQYEEEIKALLALTTDNLNAQMGIKTRKRAIDIIIKDLVFAESEHERTHQLWERVDVCLSKIAGIQVPNGLELNLNDEKDFDSFSQKPSGSSNGSTAQTAPQTPKSYSRMSGTLTWGRTLMRKLKRQKTSNSMTTLTSFPSSVSQCSEKRQEREDGLDLSDEDWFHGSLPRIESNKLLTKKGDFLVRHTQQNGQQCYVVSVLWNGYRHFIISTDSQGQFKFEGPTFTTISDLIDYYQYNRIMITQKSGALLLNPIPRERWELNHDDIELKEKIGRGNFGDVYRGILKKTGTGTLKEMFVAVKTCKINLPDEQKRKFLSEGRILKQYNHPNIVQLIGICVHKQPVMIVMELVEGGALLNYLRSNSNRVKLNSLQLMRMCIDSASGMEYLENKNCIHRDLAARNCLIGLDNVVKISDFGMSREANMELEYTVSDGMKQIPIKWTAPEALNYGRYTTLCDVWSFGILMWEIFTLGSTPYSGMSNAKARELIDNGYRLPCPPKTPQNVYQLMAKCWEYEPENRPHFNEIKRGLEERYVDLKNKEIKANNEQNNNEIHL